MQSVLHGIDLFVSVKPQQINGLLNQTDCPHLTVNSAGVSDLITASALQMCKRWSLSGTLCVRDKMMASF